ncbi:MAG: NAD(P)H-dependent flavin oxidoreductase [Chloroflexota bacterium]
MKHTRVCDLFGIQYPIIQGGMGGISSPELVAAVSNAGGLGLLSGLVQGEGLREQIRRTRQLTSYPFGVNVPLFLSKVGDVDGLLSIIAQEGVPVIATAAGNPMPLVPRLKEMGFKVMHVVASARGAQRAEQAGADAVVAEGFEAGGLLGRDQVTTMALVPSVVDSVKVPVVAAGGIADARGVAAALALGAEGVQIGTRFIATTECSARQGHKEAVLAAQDADTEVVDIPFGQARLLKAEPQGEQGPTDLYSRYPAGQIAGVVREIKSVGEVIRELVQGYDRIVDSLR